MALLMREYCSSATTDGIISLDSVGQTDIRHQTPIFRAFCKFSPVEPETLFKHEYCQSTTINNYKKAI